MTTWQIVVASILEVVAMFLIARLWFGHRRLVMRRRLFWSLLLLLPFLGVAAYMACYSEPDEELFDTYTAEQLGSICENERDSHIK
jgi:hypothetical protein